MLRQSALEEIFWSSFSALLLTQIRLLKKAEYKEGNSSPSFLVQTTMGGIDFEHLESKEV